MCIVQLFSIYSRILRQASVILLLSILSLFSFALFTLLFSFFSFFFSCFLPSVFFFPQLSCKWRIVTTVNSTISNVSICLSFFFKHKIYIIIFILDRKWDSFLEWFTLLLNSHCVSAKLICGGGIIDLNTPIAYFTWGVCWMLNFVVNWWRNSQQTQKYPQ